MVSKIQYASGSRTGGRHLALGRGCQDSCRVLPLEDGGGCVLVVSDGLGSMPDSGKGAAVAVATVAHVLKPLPHVGASAEEFRGVAESYLRTAFTEALRELGEMAEGEGRSVTDYDCTLAAAVYTGSDVLYGTVGDGCVIVVDSYGNVRKATSEMNGETTDRTFPLSSGPAKWQFGHVAGLDEEVAAVIVTTDGLKPALQPVLIGGEKENVYRRLVAYVVGLLDVSAADLETRVRNVISLGSGTGCELFDHYATRLVGDDVSLCVAANPDLLDLARGDVAEGYLDEPDWSSLARGKCQAAFGDEAASSLKGGEAS